MGFLVFVAHDDIDPSKVWEEEILRQLQSCHVFLLLLSRRFHSSKWTDQETGIAIARGKLVVPLRVDVNPYGFAARYQAFGLGRNKLRTSCLNLFGVLKQEQRTRSRAISSLINAFAGSKDFSDAGDKAELLQECRQMTRRQISGVLEASIANAQICKSIEATRNLATIIRRHRKDINQAQLKRYNLVSIHPIPLK